MKQELIEEIVEPGSSSEDTSLNNSFGSDVELDEFEVKQDELILAK